MRGEVQREVISRVLQKKMVESVPLLAWRLAVEGQAGLQNGCPDLRTDWQLWSCKADWRVVVAAEDHSLHGLATPAPWMAGLIPADSELFVSHASDAHLQAVVPQNRRPRRAPSLLALQTHAGTPPVQTHESP